MFNNTTVNAMLLSCKSGEKAAVDLNGSKGLAHVFPVERWCSSAPSQIPQLLLPQATPRGMSSKQGTGEQRKGVKLLGKGDEFFPQQCCWELSSSKLIFKIFKSLHFKSNTKQGHHLTQQHEDQQERNQNRRTYHVGGGIKRATGPFLCYTRFENFRPVS